MGFGCILGVLWGSEYGAILFVGLRMATGAILSLTFCSAAVVQLTINVVNSKRIILSSYFNM